MKQIIFIFAFIISISCPITSYSNNLYQAHSQDTISSSVEHADAQASSENEGPAADGHGEHQSPPVWTVIPFVLLLLMIATGPLFYEHFWHKNYPKIAVALAIFMIGYYVFALHNIHGPVHSMVEYVQFIALLSSLYIASGGILIQVDKKGTPFVNVGLLVIGSVVANLIGTTGASMLLIRPFIRLNQGRVQPYHIIFFIFMISNVGGALTPIGDPPLFLGFLRGVPFFWTLTHNFVEWAFAIAVLAGVFYFIDRKNKQAHEMVSNPVVVEYTNKITISGTRNFLWLGVVILSVFIDPKVFSWVPGILYDGQEISFIREIIMFSVAYLSFRFASKKALKGNDFNFEPIREVAFLFVGIFATMIPALELVGEFAQSETGEQLITHNTLYWGTGLLSGFLDNAPTYINFLSAAMASHGADIGKVSDVVAYAQGEFHDSILELTAISIAAVFFGAMTYIGNGPNFMVKSIAEQIGIRMPSFFGYVIRFSIPILLPILIVVWLLFFAIHPA